jgi:16S rRNA (guanine527-N7)-methyltransferase
VRQWGIAEHAAAMGLTLSSRALDQLDALLKLLSKWNRVYNLTSLREERELVSHHLLDSLSILGVLPSGRSIDVGSGGGFPGIPIAVAEPQREIVLLDSNSKKTAFLRQAVAELQLTNVSVQTQRVESFRPTQLFDVVISRAFADLPTFVELAGHLCASGGRLVAMKGTYPHDELARLPSGCLEKVMSLEVPMLDAQRHAVFLHPQAMGSAHSGS